MSNAKCGYRPMDCDALRQRTSDRYVVQTAESFELEPALSGNGWFLDAGPRRRCLLLKINDPNQNPPAGRHVPTRGTSAI